MTFRLILCSFLVGGGLHAEQAEAQAKEVVVEAQAEEAVVELTEFQAKKVSAEVFQKLAAERKDEISWEPHPTQKNGQLGEITAGGKKMRCYVEQFGQASEGERSLWISMHGGGGAPARVNDGQWRNQMKLYQPKEGFYLAPRAPSNTWNLWHEAHIDVLFSRLIEYFVTQRGVDPNRVYILGYSAGGDGVYQLAPRMADRLGAASMMAGHPNDASPDGLYNLPFMIFMGGKDAAYDRNKIAAQWGEKIAALQKERGGYEHKVTIYPELGHWMNGQDKVALPWMADKTRVAWPKRVVWGESGIRSKRFYWLGGVEKEVTHAAVEGQTIALKGAKPKELFLSNELIDLDRPIKVTIDGATLFEGPVKRTRQAIERSLKERLDPAMVATAILLLP